MRVSASNHIQLCRPEIEQQTASVSDNTRTEKFR